MKTNKNLDNIIAKAKNSATSAKALKSDYKEVPGFKDYEYNSAGVLRSKKTGKVQVIPTGKKAYLLFDSSGKRRQLANEILDSMFAKPAKVKKAGKKNYIPQDVDTSTLIHKPGIKSIVDSSDKKHYKMYLLSKKELTNKEIAALLQTNTGHVYNELKRYAENPNRSNA